MYNIIPRFISIYNSLNQWYHQEYVQNTIGAAQCLGGLFGIFNLVKDYQLSRKDIKQQTWKIKATKIIETLGNLSLIGSALTSRPMLQIWRWPAQWLLLPGQIQRLFFIINIANIIFGFPSTLKTTYDAYFWIIRKTAPLSHSPVRHAHERRTQLVVIVNEVIENSKFA